MPFQFSMKWVLAAMAYAAVAAAAYTQRVGMYVDLLWMCSVAAFAYSVLLARYAAGERQAWATGFAVLWACTMAWMHFAPNSFPTRRLLNSVGESGAVEVVPVAQRVQLQPQAAEGEPIPDQEWDWSDSPRSTTPERSPYSPIPSSPWRGSPLTMAPYATPNITPGPPATAPMAPNAGPIPAPGPLAAPAPAPRVVYVDVFHLRLRAVNAVATMVAGIAGGMLGSLAYRNCRQAAR